MYATTTRGRPKSVAVEKHEKKPARAKSAKKSATTADDLQLTKDKLRTPFASARRVRSSALDEAQALDEEHEIDLEALQKAAEEEDDEDGDEDEEDGDNSSEFMDVISELGKPGKFKNFEDFKSALEAMGGQIVEVRDQVGITPRQERATNVAEDAPTAAEEVEELGMVPGRRLDVKQVQELLVDAKGIDVQCIDVGRPDLDHIIFCSGTSSRHLTALAERLVSLMKETGAYDRCAYRIDGRESGEWLVVDLGDVVVNFMAPQTRRYYDLENMWRNDPSMRTPLSPISELRNVNFRRMKARDRQFLASLGTDDLLQGTANAQQDQRTPEDE